MSWTPRKNSPYHLWVVESRCRSRSPWCSRRRAVVGHGAPGVRGGGQYVGQEVVVAAPNGGQDGEVGVAGVAGQDKWCHRVIVDVFACMGEALFRA